MKKVLLPLLLLAIAALCFSQPARAHSDEIQMRADCTDSMAYEGQKIEIVLSISDMPNPAACFDIEITGADDRLSLQSVKPLGDISSGEIHYNAADGITRLVYYDKEGGKSPADNGELLSLTYQVEEGATAGRVPIQFQCTSIGNSKTDSMGNTSARCVMQIVPPPSSNAQLSLLVPSAGKLVPGFAPDRYSYTLEVGAGVERMSYQLKTAQVGATARVNRESLNGKGKSTRMIITVTAPDRSIQKYIITVLRRKDSETVFDQEETVDTGTTASMAHAGGADAAARSIRSPLRAKTMSYLWGIGLAVLFGGAPLIFSLVRRRMEGKKATEGKESEL